MKTDSKTRVLAYWIARELGLFAEISRKTGIGKRSLWSALHRGSPRWEIKLDTTRILNEILKELKIIEEDLRIEEYFTFFNEKEARDFIR